jgi:hypothetical protein
MTTATSNQVTVTLQLTPETERQLRERAAGRSLSVDQYIQQLIECDIERAAPERDGAGAAAPQEPPKRYRIISRGRPALLEEDTRPHPLPSPRGLLPTPPEVETIVAREVKKFPPTIMTAEAKQRLTDDLNLQYYFEGKEVLYRPTERGAEVLAVGLREIGEVIQKLSPEERLKVIHCQP